MVRLKSIFISVYFLLATVALSQGLFVLVVGGFDLAWLGAVLAALPVVLLLGSAVLLRRPRTSRRLPAYQALALAGGLTVVAAWVWTARPSVLASVHAGAMVVAFYAYTYWYSRLGRTASPWLREGQWLPDFWLTAVDGRPWHSRQVAGPLALYVFYRGNWCPFCMAQVDETISWYKNLTSRGVRLALVSPQPAHKSRKLAERHGVPAAFLVDEANRVARLLQIDQAGGLPFGLQALGYGSDTVLPTAILTDRNGQVLWADQDDLYRYRPELGPVLQVIDEYLDFPLPPVTAPATDLAPACAGEAC